MVALDLVKQSNSKIKDLPEGLVALFIGATSGIGQGALKQLARHAVKPKIYVVGRSRAASAALMDELHQLNPQGAYHFVEKDASLVRDMDAVYSVVSSNEKKLDYLFVSAGYLPFSGRQDTKESLDGSMSTRYYARIRAIQLHLPLLNNAASPHVVSILAGGQEAAIKEDDLDLRQPKNFSVIASSVHSATMGTLVLERLAAENPRISFIHSFPGVVRTPLLSRGSSGILGFIMRWVVSPLASLFASSADDAGARALSYATSSRYTVARSEAGAVPLVSGLQKATPTEKGVFLLDAAGETSGNPALLADFRKRGVDEKVWRHTIEIFDACSASA